MSGIGRKPQKVQVTYDSQHHLHIINSAPRKYEAPGTVPPQGLPQQRAIAKESDLPGRIARIDTKEKPSNRGNSNSKVTAVHQNKPDRDHVSTSGGAQSVTEKNEQRIPEIVKVKDGLRKLVEGYPENNFLPFYSSCESIPPPANVQTITSPLHYRKSWVIVKTILNDLSLSIRNPQWIISRAFRQAILNYQRPDVVNAYNFKMLDRPDLRSQLVSVVPVITEFALKLDSLLRDRIPLLKCNGQKFNATTTIFMTRELCCSLLANAFFCTFPENRNSQLSDFNFFRLYNDTQSQRCEVKVEKMKCILSYFSQMDRQKGNRSFLDQIISFESRKMSENLKWNTMDVFLCNVEVEGQRTIEEQVHMLQVDFANKCIGGGVLNDGSVMEEIRFCISPELLVSRLISPAMEDNEAITIKGTEIFSKYSGYSTSFRFTGETRISGNEFETDSYGRTQITVVAMDAKCFTRGNSSEQFLPNLIERELLKATVAFAKGTEDSSPVATGNWGCGAFNGNPGLKFVIQWMAASNQGCPLMVYHTMGNHKQSESIVKFSNLLLEKKVSIRELYSKLIQSRNHLSQTDDVLSALYAMFISGQQYDT